MIKLIVYLFPVLVNIIAGGVLFCTNDYLSRSGASSMTVGATSGTWYVIYIVVSLLCGRLLRYFRAVQLISAGGLLMAAACAGLAFCQNTVGIFTGLFFCGIGIGLYCAPFETYMDAVSPDDQPLVKATASYTFAWSLGVGVGPFISALLAGWVPKLLTYSAMALVTTVGILVLDKYCRKNNLLAGHGTHTVQKDEYEGFPKLIMLAWATGTIATIAITVVRSFWPYKASTIGLDAQTSGYIMALASFGQCIPVIFLARCRTWMYKWWMIVLAGLVESIGLLMLWRSGDTAELYLASLLVGIGSGIWYNFFTFHALVDRKNAARNASVNEALVGVAATVGPFVAGMVTSPQHPGTSFMFCAIMMAVSLAVVGTGMARRRHS